MTIGFDASRAFVEGRTGTENYSFQLLKAIAKFDTENKYLIYLRDTRYEIRDKDEWPENFQFITINLPRLWTQLGLAWRTFVDPLDVLFVPSHTLPLIRRPGLKTVITVHDLGAEYLPFSHQLKQLLYLKLMTHYQLKTATKIIAVSKATKADIVKRVGIEEKKIAVVYEGVGEEFRIKQSLPIGKNLELRIDRQRDILRKFGLEKEKYFLFVGTIQPRKNLERLIKAFQSFLRFYSEHSENSEKPEYQRIRDSEASEIQTHRLTESSEFSGNKNPNFKLILIGGKGWKSDSIYNLPKELGIEDRVKFLGRVSDQDLVGLYNGALALTYPSLFEGFGLPILEAFACGVPVITSNLSSMPEIAGEAAILVNPYSEGEITEAILKITKNDKLRNNLIHKGIIRAREFDWKKTAIETLKVLKEVVKSNG